MKPVKKPNYINFKVLQFIFKQWSKIATSFFQDQLFEIIENSQVHFIHCILPEPLDGLIDSQLVSLSDEDGGKTAPTFSVPYVREQLNNSFLLESMRIHRQGKMFTSFQGIS